MFLPSFRRRWTLPDFPPPRLASEWLPGGAATPVDCIWLWEWWCHAIRWDRRARRMGRRGREMSRRRRGFVIRYMMASAVFFGTVTPAKEKNTFGWDSVDETSAVFFFQLRLFPESLRWPLDIKQTRIHVLIQILREKNASVFEILCAFRVRYEFFFVVFLLIKHFLLFLDFYN